MTVAVNEFKKRVARKLRILAVGEPLNAEDAELIGQKMTALENMLEADGLLSIRFDDGVEEMYVEPLTSMVAALAASEFEMPGPMKADLIADGGYGLPLASLGERQLRKIIAGQALQMPVQFTSY